MQLNPSLTSETRLGLKQAATTLGVSTDAVRRYVLHGTKDRRSGTITRLEHFRLGGRLYTTREALTRFIAATTAAGEPGHPVAAQLPPDQTAGHRQAVEALRRQGL